MNKAVILVAFIMLSLNVNGQKRKIPFFGKIKLTELCGSNDCRPTYGIKAYIHKNDKLYYNGDYNSILGRVISTSIFDTESSGINNITRDDVDYFVEHNGSGSIEQKSKTEFDANATANLTQLLKSTIDLPENLKVELLAVLDKTVTKNTKNEIDFSFRIIQLKNVGDIDKEVSEAFSKLNKGEKIITGISVVAISGKWTSDTLKEVLDEFELSAKVNDDLSAEAILKYEKSKKRVLDGKVKEFGFIIGDSFKQKK